MKRGVVDPFGSDAIHGAISRVMHGECYMIGICPLRYF